MTKHYILTLDPTAKYEWDRCTLRDPISADHPALSELVAAAVGEQAGTYLVAVNIEVQVLEQAQLAPTRKLSAAPVAVPVPSEAPLRSPQLTELVA